MPSLLQMTPYIQAAAVAAVESQGLDAGETGSGDCGEEVRGEEEAGWVRWEG